jgi:protein phosphatase 1 regulatory subunit 42
MVRLTIELLMRCSSSFIKKRRDESKKVYLRRVTHLHLENRDIDDIGDEFSFCHSLTVLYMYDNLLTCFPNLDHSLNLTHLYLQNNNIDRIQGLVSLVNLTKLYIGSNSIVVIEGLETLHELQELHIENQRLEDGEKMLFDRRSIQAIAGSLLVLNISGNRVTSLSDLDSLRMLKHLAATDNKLHDLRELLHLLSTSWRRLQHLNVANNPLCCRPKYRDQIIVAAPALEMLDDAEISETAKQFLCNWQANKDAVRQRHASSTVLSTSTAQQTLADENRYLDLVHKNVSDMYPTAPSAYFMPALNRQKFQHYLERSHSQHQSQQQQQQQQQQQVTGEADQLHSELSYLLGYSNGGQPIGDRRVSSMDRIQSRLHQLSLRNISLDGIHS